MNSHASYSKELFEQGYNCCQSVLAAFCDKTSLDFETSLKLSSSFGGGMGRLREVCGAVSGMFMVVGLINGYTDPNDKLSKSEHYNLIQSLGNKFKAENGSIICRELLKLPERNDSPIPEDRTKEYYKKRPCSELVANAASILDEYFKVAKVD